MTIATETMTDEQRKPVALEYLKAFDNKCVLIANTRKYHERDEKEYIREIYPEGKPFVTSGSEFVLDHVLEHNVKHAGIILIPKVYNYASAGDLHTALTSVAKTYIQELGRNALRRHIIYIAEDGLRVLDDKGKDDLLAPYY